MNKFHCQDRNLKNKNKKRKRRKEVRNWIGLWIADLGFLICQSRGQHVIVDHKTHS